MAEAVKWGPKSWRAARSSWKKLARSSVLALSSQAWPLARAANVSEPRRGDAARSWAVKDWRGDVGDPVADEGGLGGELGDDGVGILIAEGCGDGSVRFDVEVEFGALADDLAEVLALQRGGGRGAGDEHGGDGAVDLGPEVSAAKGDRVGRCR